jgi:hypothetical protein
LAKSDRPRYVDGLARLAEAVVVRRYCHFRHHINLQ